MKNKKQEKYLTVSFILANVIKQIIINKIQVYYTMLYLNISLRFNKK